MLGFKPQDFPILWNRVTSELNPQTLSCSIFTHVCVYVVCVYMYACLHVCAWGCMLKLKGNVDSLPSSLSTSFSEVGVSLD